MRRGRVLLILAAGSFASFTGSNAFGAKLLVDAPAPCVDTASLAEEVGDLIGRPLAEVVDVDFRIRIAEKSPGKWLLHPETVDQGAPADASASTTHGSREIGGATCAELAEAAAVTIAVSVRSMDAAKVTATTSVAPKRPTTAQSPATSTPSAIATPPAVPPSRHPAVTVALVTDTGTLPGTGPGVEAEGNLQHASLRLTLLAAWFTSRDVVGSQLRFPLAFWV